ncbi:MAG: lipase/acyltransferase domain-containing protein, partial [Pyrinomonadaceae bacterium]
DDLEYARELEVWLKDFKFDVIAHSMGGLIARYFLYYGAQELGDDGPLPKFDWRGAQQVDKLILVGTPNLGSPEAFKNLTSGYKKKPLPFYNPAVVGSFPAAYQLLPQWDHGLFRDDQGAVEVDLFNVDTWKKNNWGIVNSDIENVKELRLLIPNRDAEVEPLKEAESYLSWCLRRAKRFHDALNETVPEMGSPPDTKTFLAIGRGQETWTDIYVEHKDGRLQPIWDEKRRTRQGDGTVPERSALAGRNLPVVTVIGPLEAEHIALTWHPTFLEKLREILGVKASPSREEKIWEKVRKNWPSGWGR